MIHSLFDSLQKNNEKVNPTILFGNFSQNGGSFLNLNNSVDSTNNFNYLMQNAIRKQS